MLELNFFKEKGFDFFWFEEICLCVFLFVLLGVRFLVIFDVIGLCLLMFWVIEIFKLWLVRLILLLLFFFWFFGFLGFVEGCVLIFNLICWLVIIVLLLVWIEVLKGNFCIFLFIIGFIFFWFWMLMLFFLDMLCEFNIDMLLFGLFLIWDVVVVFWYIIVFVFSFFIEFEILNLLLDLFCKL